MKRYSIIIALVFVVSVVQAQTRLNVANFSQFQQYFNPALTGNAGTSIKNFYRDQFINVDDAPRTLFLSGEVNLADITKTGSGKLQHSFGLSLVNDTYGALRDNRIALSYGSGVKLTEKLNLKAGLAVTYNNSKIDYDKLVMNEDGDQAYMALVNGGGKVNKYGVNLGVAVTSDDFYAGYALADAIKKESSESQSFEDMYVMQHIVQAGYRKAFTQPFSVVVNGIYRYDAREKGIAEGQVKGVYNNTFWIGAGYRNDLAYTFNTGFQFNQFRIGYSREINSNNVNNSFNGGNELTLTYNFTPSFTSKKLSIW